MNKFLYVLTQELADKLLQEDFEMLSPKDKDKKYWLFAAKSNMPASTFSSFTAGQDYVYSDKLFF